MLLTLSLLILGSGNKVMALQQEDSGTEVTDLQTQLANAGYYLGPITGYYGDLTAAAVTKFQQDQGLAVDGVAGAETLSALANFNAQSTEGASGGLKLGSSGDRVVTLQTDLQNAGYFDSPITGDFGSLTEAAVIKFQQDQGLVADGIVGSATQSALQRRSRTPNQSLTTTGRTTSRTGNGLQPGDSGEDVAKLQSRLRDAGYYDGPVTGYYGADTQGAVTQFQQDRGLQADGVAGSATMNSLNPLPSNAFSNSETTGVDVGRFSVLELQKRLKARGFDPGAIDGNFGSQTRAAVQAAQQYYGVSESDILNGSF